MRILVVPGRDWIHNANPSHTRVQPFRSCRNVVDHSLAVIRNSSGRAVRDDRQRLLPGANDCLWLGMRGSRGIGVDRGGMLRCACCRWSPAELDAGWSPSGDGEGR